MSDPLPPSPSSGTPAPGLPPAILDAAALHLARRDRGATPAEDAAFAAWLAADPRHRAAAARLSAAWASLDALRDSPAAPDQAPASAPLPFPTPARSARLWPWLAAACLALCFGLLAVKHLPAPPPLAFSTPVGASATHLLPDGTRLRLNTDSALELAFTPSERRARLTRGEACFEVTPDPARPFVVEIDSARVRVLGTVFNLRRHPDHVDLVVAEGRVQAALGPAADTPAPAAHATLGPGDHATLALAPSAPHDTIRVEPLDAAALARALAWRDGRLVFSATPLSEALREFGRHHPVRLEISDPDLAGLLIGGAYSSTDLEGFLALLQAGFGVRVERPAPDHVRLYRAAPASP